MKMMIVLKVVPLFVGSKSGIEVNFLWNFPMVCDHLLVVSIINGVIRNPKFGYLNFRVTQFSMGDSCVTQSDQPSIHNVFTPSVLICAVNILHIAVFNEL